MARAISQRDREVRIALARAGARHSHVVEVHYTWRRHGKSAQVKISTEAPPPKSLEVEPGNTYILDDVTNG